MQVLLLVIAFRLSVLLALIVAITSACGSDSTPASTPSVATTAPTTAALADPIPKASPPPAAFAEVEADYNNSVESLLAEGRAAADELVANDPAALYARFDESMAAETSIGELPSDLDELLAIAPLSRGPDRAFQRSPAVGIYRAEFDWRSEIFAITFYFNENSEIFRLDLEGQSPLPPDPAAEYESEVTFRLPFEGLWFVIWGGDTTLDNRHLVSPDQRHAYDIFVWNDGGTHTGDASVNENYWAYAQPVLAPAAGTVVTAIDGLPDQTPQQSTDQANPAGNHVVIEVADGEYLLIAHLQPGSLTVTEGDVVESGQQIGLVGNSGNTSEPHIHIHLQDQPTFDPATATGLPLEFSDYLADGVAVERGKPLADQFIATG